MKFPLKMSTLFFLNHTPQGLCLWLCCWGIQTNYLHSRPYESPFSIYGVAKSKCNKTKLLKETLMIEPKGSLSFWEYAISRNRVQVLVPSEARIQPKIGLIWYLLCVCHGSSWNLQSAARRAGCRLVLWWWSDMRICYPWPRWDQQISLYSPELWFLQKSFKMAGPFTLASTFM